MASGAVGLAGCRLGQEPPVALAERAAGSWWEASEPALALELASVGPREAELAGPSVAVGLAAQGALVKPAAEEEVPEGSGPSVVEASDMVAGWLEESTSYKLGMENISLLFTNNEVMADFLIHPIPYFWKSEKTAEIRV